MQDFIDFIEILTAENVRFLIVGSFAMAHFGYVRATGDLDILVEPTTKNSELVYKCLKQFGAPTAAHGVYENTFSKPGIVYQIGLPPNRIDILTEISGVSYIEAENSKVKGKLGASELAFLSLAMLIQNKSATGREKDLLDVIELRKLKF